MKRAADRLAEQPFDILVIGGGVLGAFVAWDAALRGLRTGLIERDDFASGTTSASGRVLHGGLRSLQYMDPADAVNSMREQAAVASLAPDLVRPIPFLFPTGTGFKEQTLLRLAAPAWGAFPRVLGFQRDLPFPRFHASSRTLEPELRSWAPRGGLLLWDYQIGSPERLVIAVLQAAAAAGAAIANRIEALEVLDTDGGVSGVRAMDREAGAEITIRSATVLNAAGPWATGLWDQGTRLRHPISFARGVHLVADVPPPPAALGLDWQEDSSSGRLHRGRRMFALPWEGRTLVGASWTPITGSPEAVVEPTLDEVQSFTTSLDVRWPELGLAPDRIRFATAGLYPVFGSDVTNAGNYAASRRPLVIDHGKEGGPAGLVTAVSAKLTTARALAETLVDKLARQQRARGVRSGLCGTAAAGPLPAARPVMIPGAEDPAFGSGVASRIGEAAAREEMALSLEDIVLRRSSAGLRGVAARDVLDGVARGAGLALGWSSDRIQQEVADTEALYRRMGVFAEGGRA